MKRKLQLPLKKFFMDDVLYFQIHTTAREAARKFSFDPDIVSDLASDAFLFINAKIEAQKESSGIKNVHAFARGIIIHKIFDYYRSQRKIDMDIDDIDWLADEMDQSIDKLLNNQARNFSSMIDEVISRQPKLFTKQNKKLWEIFKKQKYSTVQMMEMMGIRVHSTFYAAKARLIERIISIYKEMSASNPT